MRSVIKRLMAVVCAGIMLFVVLSFGFVGCDDAEQKRIEELEAELVERSETIKRYLDGEILDLDWAYSMGLISYDDLLSIAYYFNGGNKYNEDVMPENFTPKPKTPDRLGDEYTELLKKKLEKSTKERYSEEYFQKIADALEGLGVTLEYGYEEYITNIMNCIKIREYYGTYNGCVAMTYDQYVDYGEPGIIGTPVSPLNIGGVNFNGRGVCIWVFN